MSIQHDMIYSGPQVNSHDTAIRGSSHRPPAREAHRELNQALTEHRAAHLSRTIRHSSAKRRTR